MALVFTYYLGKFAPNIYPGLKGKQIKHKKTKSAHFFVILTKIKFVYTFKNFNFVRTIPPIRLKQI